MAGVRLIAARWLVWKLAAWWNVKGATYWGA
jgi:hypothetical protein